MALPKTSMYVRAMKALVLLLALPGCAAAIQVGTASPDPNPVTIGTGSEPSSQIIIYRTSEVGLLTQVATTPALLIDGRSVGTCRFEAPLRLRVPAGNYTITALTQNGEENQWVVVEEGETQHLRFGVVSAPSLAPKPRLDRVSEEVAAREAGL